MERSRATRSSKNIASSLPSPLEDGQKPAHHDFVEATPSLDRSPSSHIRKANPVTQHTPVMSEHEYRENTFFSIFGSVPEPAFESPAEQIDGWGRVWGCVSDVGKLRAVLMHRPGD